MTAKETNRSNILITGGTRGIGAACARNLSSAGYNVFVTSRSGEESLSADGVNCLRLDVRSDTSVAQCIDEMRKLVGNIDVLVNNAGYDLYGSLEDTSFEEFYDQVDTNFLGAVRLTKAVLPLMRIRRRGRIVSIGSLGGRVGLPLNGAYAASKFALEGLMESLRLEMKPFGVHVSTIVPGAVSTDTLETSVRPVEKVSDPYRNHLNGLIAKMRSDGRQSAVRPEHVAAAVRRAVEDPKPKRFYSVGKEANLVPRLKALLPQGVFEAIMVGLFSNLKKPTKA